jgi:hypothetical protein
MLAVAYHGSREALVTMKSDYNRGCMDHIELSDEPRVDETRKLFTDLDLLFPGLSPTAMSRK